MREKILQVTNGVVLTGVIVINYFAATGVFNETTIAGVSCQPKEFSAESMMFD